MKKHLNSIYKRSYQTLNPFLMIYGLNLAQSEGARAPKRPPNWSPQMLKNAKSLEKVGGKVRPRNQA